MTPPPKRIRRVRYAKEGKIRFTSHRDVARLWERALRRASIPVAYSQGFSPRPKLSFGLALPTGYESTAEYVDVELQPDLACAAPDDFSDMVDDTLPSGMTVLAAAEVRSDASSLQQAVTSCIWEITLTNSDRDTIEASIDAVLGAGELRVERKRKGKTVVDDIRPLITAIELHDEPVVRIIADLGTKPRALRPDELLTALSIPLDARTVRRTAQLIDAEDSRLDPLTVEGVSDVHTRRCAP